MDKDTSANPPADGSLRRNSDPLLEPANQHVHEHLHHANREAGDDNIVYAKDGQSTIPPQSHLHHHHKNSSEQRISDDHIDVEKQEAKNGEPPVYEGDKVGVVTRGEDACSEEKRPSWVRRKYRRYRWVVHVLIFLLFTGWWIAGLVLHRNDKNWVVPFLLWLAITVRIFFFYVRSSHVSRPIVSVWQHTGVVVYDRIPAKLRTPLGAVVTVSAVLIGSFVSEEFEDNTRENRAVSLFGIAFTLFVFWLFSKHRRAINWRPVIGGMLAQYVIALFVLRTTVGYDIFSWIANRASDLLGYARNGVAFLTDPDTAATPTFFFSVLPAIIFFVSLVQVLYFWGILQWFIAKVAVFIFWMLQVSGAEAVVAAATPFIGQGESALLVRPFVPHMTKAELHQILTCGFATISGSVLIAYIELGLDANAMVSSCVMSIPASLAMSKLRYPETEETLTAGRVVIPDDDEHKAANAIHAFANGAWLGIKIAGSIVASILCIIALVGLIDGLLTWWGKYLNIPALTLNFVFGYLMVPVAFLLGVPRGDKAAELLRVGRLISQKVIVNEYAAFTMMKSGEDFVNGNGESIMSPRAQLIATYALCGFGNIGSLGIQIGILSQLAPSRAGDVARLAVSALITGVVTTLTSAAVAGLVMTQ